MEITSFVLGMLTIVAAIMITAIVVGMVKINQLKNKTENLTQLCAAIESDLRHEITNVYDSMNREDEGIRRIIEDTNRDITLVERTIMQRIDKVDEEHNKHEDDIHRQIDQTKSYIDSRIDKVIVKGTLDGSKQVIKG
jgi:predicted PurR-regulated permease PerM